EQNGREVAIRRCAKDSRTSSSSSGGYGRARPGGCRAPLFRFGWSSWIPPWLALEAEDLVNEDDRDAAGQELAVDDEDLVHAAVHAVRRLGAGILEREHVLVDAAETLLEVGHDLLRPHDEDQPPRTGHVGAELAATERGREQRSTLSNRMHAAEHDIGRGGEAADLVGLRLAIHVPDSRPERLVAPGFLDLLG